MELRTFILLQVFLTSLIAPLIAYLVNTTYDLQGGRGLLVAGIASLSFVSFLTYRAISSLNEPSSWIYYCVFAMGMFSSAIDLLIGLENDGFVEGFMTNYLKSGEPYLTTVHGTMICYFDGMFHYAMYIIMLYLMAQRKNHWQVGLYWAGSIGHSMIVFMPGNILGHHSIHPSILLNIPYCIFPFAAGMHFFNHKQQESYQKNDDVNEKEAGLFSKVITIIMASSFVFIIFVSLFRGFAVIDPQSHELFTDYISLVEPYLMHANSYPKMQMLTFMYFFVPVYLICIIWMVDPRMVRSIKKWSIILAGASLQAQLVHMGSSVRMNRNLLYSPSSHTLFWSINLSLLVLPQIFLIHLHWKPSAGGSHKIKNS